MYITPKFQTLWTFLSLLTLLLRFFSGIQAALVWASGRAGAPQRCERAEHQNEAALFALEAALRSQTLLASAADVRDWVLLNI